MTGTGVQKLRVIAALGLGAATALALSGCLNMGEYFLTYSDEQCQENAERLVTWVENTELVTSATVADVVAERSGDKYCYMKMDVNAPANMNSEQIVRVHDDVREQIDAMYLFTWNSPIVIHSGKCTIEVGPWDASSREAFDEPNPICLTQPPE